MTAVGVGRVATKRRHLHLPGAAGTEHRDHAERRPHCEGAAVAENRPHLIGMGRRRDVVVGRRAAEQFIANAAAGPERLVARRPQSADHDEGKFTCRGGITGDGGHGGGGSGG